MVFHLIDRRDKLAPEEWEKYALDQGLSSEQLAGLKQLLGDKDLWRQSDELCGHSPRWNGWGLMDYVRFDPQIIRGLDYYTGIVFEAKDLDGGRSILGGGHYDNLVAAVGGDPLPAVGFAMGDVMITLVLEKYGMLPELTAVPRRRCW